MINSGTKPNSHSFPTGSHPSPRPTLADAHYPGLQLNSHGSGSGNHPRHCSSLPYSHSSVDSPANSIPPAVLPSRSLLTVIPPASLPNDPPHPRVSPACTAYGPPSAFSRGTLIPLYPTLSAQLAAIAREYGLPSTGGMVVYMIEGSPQAGELAKHLAGGPRIGDEAWQLLWAGIFEDEEADAFQDELLARERLQYEHEHELELEMLRHRARHRARAPLSGRTDDEEEILDPSLSSATDDPEPSLADFPAPPLQTRKAPWPLPPRRGSQDEDQARSTRLSGRSSPSTASVDSSPHTLNSPRHHDLRFIRSRQPSLTTSVLPSVTSKLRPLDHSALGSADLAVHHHLSTLSSPSFQTTFRPLPRLPFAPPSRPSTVLSHFAHPRLTNGRASSLASRLERDSVYSSASRASRRVGAGVIVGKIEFDIDIRRPNGRWYDVWLNGNPSGSAASQQEESPGTIPLLLPDLVSRRNRSPGAASPRGQPRRLYMQPAPRRAPLAIATDDSDEPATLEASEPDPSQTGYQRLDSPDCSPDSSPTEETEQTGCEETEGDPLAGVFASDEQTWISLRPPKVDVSSPEPDGEAVERSETEVGEVVTMLARLEATGEQNNHLSSPIKLDSGSVAQKATGSGADWAACEEECASEQAGSTNATTSPSSGEAVTAPKEFLKPGVPLGSAKRSSSMAMEANLDELEQVLAALSPRALRPAPPARADLVPRAVDAGQVRSADASSGGSGASRVAGSKEQQHRRTSTTSPGINGGGRGGVHKFLDSLHDSYVDRKHRSRGAEGVAGGGKVREEGRERKAGRRGSAGSGASAEKIKSRANGLMGKAVSVVGGKIRGAAGGGGGPNGSGEGQSLSISLGGQRRRTRKNSSSQVTKQQKQA